jgi:D-alanyl-D-alanine carboxypeptidase
MDAWLAAALDYIPRWVEFQRRQLDQPGFVVAIDHGGETVLDRAFGTADLATGEPLTPDHRLRIASHSKTFTAAGILRLKERELLRLDDPVGAYVDDLHPEVAAVTIAQLLSHSAGLTRDGPDSGQFLDRRPYLDEAELRDDLSLPPTLPPATRFKYSNHGYGLLGLVIEAVADRPYDVWIRREVIGPAALSETEPDMPDAPGFSLACGHSALQPFGRRVAIPGRNPCRAMAAAAGFVATARDVARFFGSLSPGAARSVLLPETRREMTRRHWRDEAGGVERYYGLGVIAGPPGDWAWFGHSGAFQDFLSRTVVVPGHDLAVTVLTNAIDGPAHLLVDGILHVLRTLHERGAPSPRTQGWTGRWWSLWGAADLVPVADRVLVAAPALPTPFLDAPEIAPEPDGTGTVARAPGFHSAGESVRQEGDSLWIGGARLVTEEALRAEVAARSASA